MGDSHAAPLGDALVFERLGHWWGKAREENVLAREQPIGKGWTYLIRCAIYEANWPPRFASKNAIWRRGPPRQRPPTTGWRGWGEPRDLIQEAAGPGGQFGKWNERRVCKRGLLEAFQHEPEGIGDAAVRRVVPEGVAAGTRAGDRYVQPAEPPAHIQWVFDPVIDIPIQAYARQALSGSPSALDEPADLVGSRLHPCCAVRRYGVRA